MSDDTPRVRKACAEAREAMQEIMDGPVPAARREMLDAHLSVCDDCREVRQGFETVRTALRALPEIPLPDDALDEVWARTVDADPDEPRVSPWRPRLGVIAAVAASLLIVTLAVKWSGRLPRQTAPVTTTAVKLSDEEVERLRDEARQVLEIAAAALAKSERVAFDRVLGGEVSPAIQRIGIQWPEAPSPGDRRSKT
jgi:anti-sigma factor RsiW